MNESREYRVTFGQMYARLDNPMMPGASPYGWVAIIATDEEIARGVANATLGSTWCNIYCAPFDEAKWLSKQHMGELARIDASLTLTARPGRHHNDPVYV